jgi:TatD DNase family protein
MLIDSHCHLIHRKYEKTTDQLINEAIAEGVEKFITIGTSITENKRAIELAKKYDSVFAAIGIYPHEENNVRGKDPNKLEKLLEEQLTKSSKIVAIGECGIDISDDWEGGRNPEEQIELFEMQIKLAKKHDLPLIIHNRNGDEPILELLEKHKGSGLRGVLHCFATTWETAQKFLDLGFYISFSGMITYPSRKGLLETVDKVPNDRFIIETDAPYLPPQGHRGEVNEPKYVKIVAEKACEVKNLPFEEISRMTYENTCRIFTKLCLKP